MMSARDFRESLALAEQLARDSLRRTSTNQKRRISREEGAYVPPKQLLMYLVRMGSFTSTPKMMNDDLQDSDVELPPCLRKEELLQRCRRELEHLPPLLRRSFQAIQMRQAQLQDQGYSSWENEEEQVAQAVAAQGGTGAAPYRVMRWPIVHHDSSGCNHLRVLQWNVLAQALGQQNDNFVCCPDEALDWKTRRFRMLEELLEYSPDVICLQEVDHYNFLKKCLGTLGYVGAFFPKPDSPCIYVKGNNGPDGCAIFFQRDKFELLQTVTRVMEVWRVQSNQVVVLVVLRWKSTGQEVVVVSTHLKARQGALLSTLRNEQGKDLLDLISQHWGGRPVLICGDFNAEPSEPVYSTLLSQPSLGLKSAYTGENGSEPPYTTWKIRDEGEKCHTIDYVFYSQQHWCVEGLLKFPTAEQMGPGRVPSLSYPSDHFSLVVDLKLKSERES